MNSSVVRQNFIKQLIVNEVKKKMENTPRAAVVRLSLEEIKDLIPPFNPSSSLPGLSAEQWIETIENLRSIYKWDDRVTLLYATFRLEDGAKKWFNENMCGWQQFKVKLIDQFSPPVQRTSVFEQLLSRRKEEDESFENYAYDVERIAKCCNFNLGTTISYVISGLRDDGLRNHLFSCTINSIPFLLARIKAYMVMQKQQDLRNRLEHAKKEKNRSTREQPQLPTPEPTKVAGKRVCYRCNQPGHFARNCKQIDVENQKRPATDSSNEGPAGKMIKCEVQDPIDDCSDLIKTVLVEGVSVTAFVNLGSDCTTMQLSEAKKHNWEMKKCHTEIKGFGSVRTKSLTKVVQNITVGDVEMLTNITIVEDSAQKYPMILGRNFLDNRNVCVVKTYGGLEISYVDPTEENVQNVDTEDMDEDKLLELLDLIERDCL